MVVVEDLDDLGLVDARHALGLLGVVDQDHAPAHRRDEIGPRDEAHRAAVGVHYDRRAVVALADLLGDVGDQKLGR